MKLSGCMLFARLTACSSSWGPYLRSLTLKNGEMIGNVELGLSKHHWFGILLRRSSPVLAIQNHSSLPNV